MEKLTEILQRQNVRGAIFDLDGTLFDSMWIWDEIDRRFLAKRGIPLPPDYIAVMNTLHFAEAADYTVARFSLQETPADLMREWNEMARDAYANEIGLKAGARDFLLALRARRISLAIATSCTPDLYMPVLRRENIEDLFCHIVTTQEVPRGKAFPDIYIETARRMGLSPQECAVFEDVPQALAAAKRGGFFTVGVADEGAGADRDKARAESDVFIESFDRV